MGLDHFLKTGGWKRTPFAATKSVTLGGLDPSALMALPTILQDSYDALSIKGKPGIKFFAGMAMQYEDEQGQLQQYQSFFDWESSQDDSIASGIRDFINTHEGKIKQATMFMVAALPNTGITIPAAQMTKNIQETHQRMFDRARYEFGTYETQRGLEEAAQREMDASEAADRLLQTIGRVYGGHVLLKENPLGSPSLSISDVLFTAMEKGEMPDRHKGRNQTES